MSALSQFTHRGRYVLTSRHCDRHFMSCRRDRGWRKLPEPSALPGLIVVRHSGMTLAFKTTFEVFPGVGPDNSLERLTERSVGLVTDQPSNVDELLLPLL